MHRACGNIPFHSVRNLSQYRSAVRTLTEPENREKHRLFERTKNLSHAYIVVKKNPAVNRLDRREKWGVSRDLLTENYRGALPSASASSALITCALLGNEN